MLTDNDSLLTDNDSTSPQNKLNNLINIRGNIQKLEEIIDYKFKETKNILNALNHSSVYKKTLPKSDSVRDFDRLEFLGDRILNFVIADAIFSEFLSYNEGNLSKRFVSLVRFETCAKIAKEINLDKIIIVAPGTHLDDEHVLCDAIEALIAALYLDGGLETVRKFILSHWGKMFRMNLKYTEPKNTLQEWSQKNYKSLPEYSILEKRGEEHVPLYKVAVKVANLLQEIGEGSSIKSAAKNAAEKFLLREKITDEN